jgi:hypothetical protein
VVSHTGVVKSGITRMWSLWQCVHIIKYGSAPEGLSGLSEFEDTGKVSK